MLLLAAEWPSDHSCISSPPIRSQGDDLESGLCCHWRRSIYFGF